MDAVYVSGPFRGWAETADEAYRLSQGEEGAFAIRLALSRESRLSYKYVLHMRDGSRVWWADPTKPSSGSGDLVNNYAPSGLEILAPQFIQDSPGFVEEAALDLRLQPVAALNKNNQVVKVRIGFLEGDVERATLVFPGNQSIQLQPSVYRKGNVPYEQFSGFITLPGESISTGFVIAVEDSGKVFRVGQKGVLAADEQIDQNNSFPFVFDAESQRLNNQDIYQIPLWSIDAVWYQIFPERFRNGDPSNDAPGPLPGNWQTEDEDQDSVGSPETFARSQRPQVKVRDWTSDWFKMDPEENATVDWILGNIPDTTKRDVQRLIAINRRYGGDLQGILEKIDYLEELGITAVYLNPVFESDSNHKYDTKDYRHIDRHFGPMMQDPATGKPKLYPDDEALLASEDRTDPSTWGYTRADKLFFRVASELQKRGIRVVLDGVFNHSASNSQFMLDIAKNGKDSPFFDWFEVAYRGEPEFESKKCLLSEFFPDDELTPEAKNVSFEAWFGYCTLPNHREGFPQTVFHPGFKAYLDAVIERWMQPKVVDGISFNGVDGFRLDVYGDVDQEYWRLFRQKVKSINNEALIIAEEWYDGFEILQGDQTDILMNYTARTLIESWFINTSPRERFRPSQAADFVEFRMGNHREHVKYGLWTMLESHDTDRIVSKTLFGNRNLSPRPQDGNSWDDGAVNRPDLGAPYSNDKPGEVEFEFLKTILGFQTAYMGAPMYYYGTEFGMWGSDDPTNRKPMMWPDLFDGTQTESRCVTFPDTWCQLKEDVTFTMEPNLDMYELHKRLIAVRKSSLALRRGTLNARLDADVNGRPYQLGSSSSDFLYLWGFERNFADQEFAYFVSNQNLGKAEQSLVLTTKWANGTRVVDVITNREFTIGEGGKLPLTLKRDRGVLLLQK